MLLALRRAMLRLENIALARSHLIRGLICVVLPMRRGIGDGMAFYFGNFWAWRGVVCVRNYISFLHLEI